MKNRIILDLQLACSNPERLPKKSIFVHWIQCIFSFLKNRRFIELTIRIVDESESRLLNMYFLKKNTPTNVLSFPCHVPSFIHTPLIGDLVICQKTIEDESKQNKLPIKIYMAYIVVHGSLLLIGYNHTTDNENTIMETLTDKIMKKLGYTNVNFL